MKRNTTDLKAAVVGTGFIGKVHVEALRRLGIEVVGVVGSSGHDAWPPLPEPYPSFEAMLRDPRVDVVHVATPNHVHHAQVRDALRAGKHVLCEKPLAVTAEQSAELVALSRETGCACAVNLIMRFYPQTREARARCARDELGEIFTVHGSYLQDWLLYPTDWNWRVDPALGGELRAVGDIGSHWIDLVQFVTGLEIEAVFAELMTFLPSRMRPSGASSTFASAGASGDDGEEVQVSTEDAAHVLLRFVGGARGLVAISQVNAGRRNALTFEVAGSRGSVAWQSERPDELWLGHRGQANELLWRDPAAAHAPRPLGTPHFQPATSRASTRPTAGVNQALYRALAAGLAPDGAEYPTVQDGHRAVLIGEAIAKSAREQRWIEIEPEGARCSSAC